MRSDSSSDAASAEPADEHSVTAVADEPAVTRERAPEVAPGDVLAGRYQIEAIIGKGGSGVVLRAFDRVSAAVVAVKVLKPGLTHDPRWEKRFQRELRLGRPVQHPNVCRIFDIGEADGYRFLTMEYATRGTLRDLIKKDAPLRPLPERLADAASAIAGLAAIHEAGIVHRDVKPDNMLRMEDGRLVLSDFGLATDLPDSTMVSVFVGTPHYMAPEVREGNPATTRSDVWSLGVVLHEIFFGKRPERRASRTASGVSKSSTSSTSSAIERAMLALCFRCLADDPADRPEDARAVERLFENTRRSPYAMLKSRGRRILSLASVVGAAILVVSVGFGLRGIRRAQAPAPQTRPGIPRVVPTGEPEDWSKLAKIAAKIPGHVHCFSMADSTTARVIWGTPRRANDIDVASGKMRKSPLSQSMFAVGCPAASPDGKRFLFSSNGQSGLSEIQIAESVDGRDPKTVTAGSDPIWLPTGDAFIFNIDSSHAAVFSLTLKTFRLLADPPVGGERIVLLEKAVNPTVGTVALLFGTNNADRVLSIYEGRALDHRVSYTVPTAFQIHFDAVRDEVLMSRQLSPSISNLCSFDWRRGILRSVGRYEGLDIVGARFRQDEAIVLGRHRSKDVWLYQGSVGKKVTNDGENYSAAVSLGGDMLFSKRTNDGVLSLWLKPVNGELKQVTHGPLDVGPEFSPDGHAWVYADYRRKSIMSCAMATGDCKVLKEDDLLPSWLRFSPDGRKLAYVTQMGVQRVVVMSLDDGRIKELGEADYRCAPVWASAETLWAFEGAAGRYFWSEWNISKAQKTGKQIAVTADLTGPEDFECSPPVLDSKSNLLPRIRIQADERTDLLRLPWR